MNHPLRFPLNVADFGTPIFPIDTTRLYTLQSEMTVNGVVPDWDAVKARLYALDAMRDSAPSDDDFTGSYADRRGT